MSEHTNAVMQWHTLSSMALQIMSDHLLTLSGAGQKLTPSESTLIWIPRMTNSRPCSNLRLEIADGPRQARTKRAKHSLATSTHSALSPVACKRMYAINQFPQRLSEHTCTSEEIVYIMEERYAQQAPAQRAQQTSCKRYLLSTKQLSVCRTLLTNAVPCMH